MSHGDYPHPADEFDSAVARVAPQGVHRAPRSRRGRWGAFVVVLVVFPLLAYGVVTWLSDWDGLGTGAPGTTDTSSTAGDEADPEDGADEPVEGEDDVADPTATAEPTTPATTPPPAPTADLTREVEVFNSTNTSGLAASAAERVEEAGFTSVTPGNWQGEDPDASVVYYPVAADIATAQAVAAALGIGSVQESAEEAGERIVVVLASDYSA